MFPGVIYHTAFFVLVAALLLAAIVRWARTPQGHPERQARGDLACLLAVILAAHLGVLARSHFLTGSSAFWLCTALLLPFVGAALWLIGRLLRFYRRAQVSTRRP
jgi:hypothetical protein